MKLTLNQKICEAASSNGAVQADIFDVLTPGLALRITKAGKKTWTFVYTAPRTDTRARINFGTFPGTELKVARERAKEARGHIEAGRDPRDVADHHADKTIAQLIDDRIRLEVRPDAENYLRSCMEIERRYDADVIPVVGKMAAKDFRVRDLHKIIDPINDRGSPVMANRVFADVRALLTFGVRRGEIEFNPLAALKAPNEEQERERNLSLEEIVAFWHRTPAALIRSRKAQLILKLCLVLGKRLSEICGMKRTEIDRGKMLWTIPKVRVKARNRKARDEQVPLSDLAMTLIDEAMGISNSEFVFPNDADTGPLMHRTVDKAVKLALEPTDKLPRGRYDMVPWTPHDLRRTVGTQMLNRVNGLEISKDQKKLSLNHAGKKDVSDRVYDQNDYLEDKTDALVKWGNFLARLVGEDVEQREAA